METDTPGMNPTSAISPVSSPRGLQARGESAVLQERLRRFSVGAGWAGVGCSLLVLAGWAFEAEFLKRFIPGAVSMNPLTALCFMLAGFSLGAPQHRLARPAAWLVAGVGLAKLVSYTTGVPFGVDQWLFREALMADLPGHPNQIAPNTALNFLLLALALLLPPGRGRLPEAALLVVMLSSLLAVLGYTYEVEWMYGVSAFIPMALPTALLFGLLSTSALCARPGRGITRLLLSPGPGGLLMRRLFPALIVTFIFIGWLRLQGQRHGLFDTDMAVTFFTLVTIFILAALVWWSARCLHLADERRRHTEDELDHFFELSLDLLGIAGLDGHWRRVNRAFTATLGLSQEEILARPYLELIHPDDIEPSTTQLASLAEGRPVIDFENRFRHRDGTWRWIAWKALPVPEEDLLYCTGRDITALKAADDAMRSVNEQLLQKTTQLEAANKELESFSYSVSHDLRAPLRGISGFAQALQERAADQLDATSLGYLQRVRSATDRMSALIDDLLKLSRLSRAEMRLQGVDLSALASEVLAGLREREPEREIEVLITPGLTAWGDPALLRILLENLLGNAWKFTARTPAPRIEFRLDTPEGAVPKTFLIRDNGVGFDPRYAHKLFGAFQRLHSQADFPGTGIGLAIVHRIAARHSGRVWAEGAPGQGAAFFFSL